jgi:predicted TPR repeat methyltransferase
VVFNELQQWDQALSCWQHSLTVSPDNPATHRLLGHFFYLQNRLPEALPHYRQVLALRPDDADARFSLDVLSGTARPARAPADHVTGLFDSYAGFFDKDLVERLGYRGPALLKTALEPSPPPRSLAVLDLGCGTGLCGVEFREWAQRLVGVDLSPKMLARARQRKIYDELIQSDLLALNRYPEECYDLVLAGDVLIYLGELEALMQAVSRTLRPGGRFAFTVELLGEPDYRVLPTGRFAHSQAYLQRIAAASRLREVCMNRAVIRTEQGQDVPGLAVVLSRP